jgi:hypothetical protein
MIDEADLLQTIAQISLAFAGFAGVVAAFSKFRLAPEAAIFRVRLMVVIALAILLFSLFPFLPPKFGVTELATWRLSAFLLSIVVLIIAFWSWRHLKPLYQAGLLKTQKITVVWYSAGALLCVGLLGSAAGLFGSLASAIYVTGLFFSLALCSFYFVMLMIAVELDTE